jgi:tetratricopeptide (TPR) repeat protein
VLASRPADGAAFALLADALERQESWEELAQLLLERVKQTTEPTERATLSKRLALVYRDGLGKEDLFLNWTEEAHRAVEDPDLVDELLAHYRNQGQLERVAPLLEWKVNYLTSRKQLREVPALLHDLGTLQAGLGVPDRALVALRRCVELDGSFLPGIHALAMLLFDQDQKEESLSHLQTLLLRINEFDDAAQKTDVYLRLAGIYLDKGDKKRAKTYLTRLLSIDKQNEQAKEMLATL